MATMLPPSVIKGAALRASATSEYALTSWATRNASRLVLREFTLQRPFGCERHRMQQQMQFAELLADCLKYARAISSSLVTSHGIISVSGRTSPARSSTFSLSRSP